MANKYSNNFFTYVYGNDIVPRSLILQKKFSALLLRKLGKTSLFRLGEEKLKEFIVPALRTFMGDYGVAAEGAYEGIVSIAKTFGSWYMDEKLPPFAEFGTYFFLDEEGVHPYTTTSKRNRREIQDDLRKMEFPGIDSITDHHLSKYAAFFERLVAKESASSDDV